MPKPSTTTLWRRGVGLDVVLILCLASILIGFAAAAGEDHDIARAREGVRQGIYVPLEQVLDWVEAHYRGRLLEVEFEEEDEDDGESDPPTYEIEWLTPAGHVIELEFDARDGQLIEIEGRGGEEARIQ